MATRPRIVCLTLALTVLVGRIVAQAPGHADTLTNKSVVDMVLAKLPKDLITQKITTTPASFDISSAGLVNLNDAKVSKDLIKLMMDMPQGSATAKAVPPPAPTPPPSAPPPPPAVAQNVTPPPPPPPPSAALPPPPPPASTRALPPARTPKALLAVLPTEAGIHLRASGTALTILEPTSYSASKISSTFMCIGNCVKTKAIISSAEASIRTADASAEFYFVFEQTSGSLGSSGQSWGAALTSPNEFVLLRLDKKSTHREVTTGSFGSSGPQSGTDDKAAVPFTFVRIKPGVYRVIPKEPLKPGEYGFFPASGGGQGTAGTTKLFDFGVDGP